MLKLATICLLGCSFGFSNDLPIIISLGSDCHVAIELRRHNLRYQAFPFDWNFTPFNGLYQLIEEDFAHILKDEYLILSDAGFCVKNTYYGIEFRHDFPNVNPNLHPEEQIDIYDPWEMPHYRIVDNFMDFVGLVREKYQRRIQRFYNALRGNQKVILIRMGDITKVQAIRLHHLIHNKFPALDFLLVACGEAENMRTDWGIPGIQNYSTRKVFEDWTELFKSLELYPEEG